MEDLTEPPSRRADVTGFFRRASWSPDCQKWVPGAYLQGAEQVGAWDRALWEAFATSKPRSQGAGGGAELPVGAGLAAPNTLGPLRRHQRPVTTPGPLRFPWRLAADHHSRLFRCHIGGRAVDIGVIGADLLGQR